MSEDLKPCPFCGSNTIMTEITICNAKVFCMVCSANFIRSNGRNDEENLNRVSSIWNLRQREQQLEQALLEAKEALVDIRNHTIPTFNSRTWTNYCHEVSSGTLASISALNLGEKETN